MVEVFVMWCFISFLCLLLFSLYGFVRLISFVVIFVEGVFCEKKEPPKITHYWRS